jgi:membrane-bound serine protease (ClpP class)
VRRFILILALLAFTAWPRAAPADSPSPPARCVVRAELSAIINSGTADYVQAAMRHAEQRRCSALLIVLDTPGGALQATRVIVQSFLDARVPVVVYVAPGGARAGSAGVFITMAAHIAVMAPGATIGAAHPVVGMGQDIEEAGGEQLARKVVNDTAAMARAIAQRRGRNADWAEAAVRESVSATATEALARNVVDRVAASEGQLLSDIDGTRVDTAAGPVLLATRGASVHPFEPSWRQRVWSFVGDPNVVYFLLMIGIFGLLLELYSPGLIVPGVIGGFALLLAAIGLDILPVNLGAVALLVLAAILFVAEIYVVSYGLLAAGGLIALLIGASLLIDRSDSDFFADATVRLSWGAVLPLALLVATTTLGLAWRAGRLRRRTSVTGKEAMLGQVGHVVVAIGSGTEDTPGQVAVAGERWRAIADQPIAAGARVRITGVKGLTLKVAPVAERAETEPSQEQKT